MGLWTRPAFACAWPPSPPPRGRRRGGSPAASEPATASSSSAPARAPSARERTEEADERDDEVRALETRGQRRVPVLGARLRLLAFEVRSRAVLREQLRRPARCAVPLRGPFVVHGRPPGLRVGSRDRLDRCAHDVPGSGQQAVSLVAKSVGFVVRGFEGKGFVPSFSQVLSSA